MLSLIQKVHLEGGEIRGQEIAIEATRLVGAKKKGNFFFWGMFFGAGESHLLCLSAPLGVIVEIGNCEL